MASTADYARNLLASVVPDRKDLMEIALDQLTPEHFPQESWRPLFGVFSWYYNIAGDVLTKQGLSDALRRAGVADAGKIQLYETIYESLQSQKSSEADFRFALDMLKDRYAQLTTEIALTKSMQMLKVGVQGPKGELLKGHEDARAFMAAELAKVDDRLHVQEAPDGDARDEEDDILAEYADKKEKFLSGESAGCEFGIPSIDQQIGGLQKGELDFVLGYTSSGKTSLCAQLAWWTSIMQGKNVVYVTTETLRNQVRRKMIARHSRLSKFALEEGLNSKDIKQGTLTEREEAVLKEVVHDFSSGSSYGKCRIMQASESLTLTGLNVKLQAIQREYPVDLIIIDALYILRSEDRREDDRSDLNGKIERAKILATTFNNGEGVPVISPWQTSRQEKEKADRERRYTLRAFAETAYGERYADVVISLLEPAQIQRYTTLSSALIKNRDGEQSGNIEIDVDYATSYFTDHGRASQAAATSLLFGI